MQSRGDRPGPVAETQAAGWRPCEEVLPHSGSSPRLRFPLHSHRLPHKGVETQVTNARGATQSLQLAVMS